MAQDKGKSLNCNFCGKSQKEVKKLIAGPGVYICDECIDLCTDIIQEDVAQSQSKATMESVPKPHEIKNHLDNSLMLVTALAPKIGYDNATKIAKNAHKNNTTLRTEAIKSGLIDDKEFTKIVDPKNMI